MMQRISKKTGLIIVGIAIALLSELVVLLNSIATGVPVSSRIALVGAFVVTILIAVLSLLQKRLKSVPDMPAATARETILDQVQREWITGFLENWLYYSYDEQLLPLPLRERVGSRFDLVLSNPLEPAQTMPPGTTITQVFNQAGGELLILGEPGAGKTTLLLELARDLLKCAKDPAAPIPVVLMLSSWAIKKQSLENWIVEELQKKYHIPSQVGQIWVETNQLLLLLDGLDEVAPSALSACIEAINRYYRKSHRSLVVCSRREEYLDQPGRLALYTAVKVQPLSSEQVDAYLDGLTAKGEDVVGLKHVLSQSEELRVLATTPLFLTVLILAYHGKPEQELLALVKAMPTDQQHLLFHNYVERMLQRERTRIHAPAQQAKHWLAWLARQMTARYQSESYPLQFQPDWLPKRQRAFYQWSSGMAYGLLFGLVGGLVGWLRGWLHLELLSVLFFGLVGGLLFGLFFGLRYGQVYELVGWLAFGLVCGLVCGLVFVLVCGLGAAMSLFIILRFWLWQARCTPAPWRYAAFLDDAVDQLLLRKVGRGYIFRHRLLQDYFASLEVVPPHDPSFREEARSVLQNAPNGGPSV